MEVGDVLQPLAGWLVRWMRGSGGGDKLCERSWFDNDEIE